MRKNVIAVIASIIIAIALSITLHHLTQIIFHKNIIACNIQTIDHTLQQENVTNRLLLQLKQDLERYQKSIYLEEIIGTLAVLVTISALLIPLLNFLSLNNEKERFKERFDKQKDENETKINESLEIYKKETNDSNKKIEDIKNDLKKLIQDDIETASESLKKIAITRNQITLQIYTTKSEYINFKTEYRSLGDVFSEAQTLELKLLKLLSKETKEVSSSFAWLKQIIDPKHVEDKYEYIVNLRKTLDLMYKAGYFKNAKNNHAYNEFQEFIG